MRTRHAGPFNVLGFDTHASTEPGDIITKARGLASPFGNKVVTARVECRAEMFKFGGVVVPISEQVTHVIP
jgi:hypothetical protein